VWELVDNSTNRLRFDTWSINGLIVYKEGATLLIEFYELYDCLNPQKKTLIKGDQYKEQLRFLKIGLNFLEKCVNGNFINFAICEYYNDTSFTQLSQMTMQSILNQNLDELKTYKKLHLRVYQVLEEFFKKHLELIFLRFDFGLILRLVNDLLLPGIRHEAFEIKSCALLTIDCLNEFIFNNLRKPSKK